MLDSGDDFLSLLDLKEYEAEALEELLFFRQTTAPGIAEATGISKAKIYGALGSLSEAGYVKVIPGRPKRYQPHDQWEIAQRLLEQLERGETGTETYEIAGDEDMSVIRVTEIVREVAREGRRIDVDGESVENPRSVETMVEEFGVDTAPGEQMG